MRLNKEHPMIQVSLLKKQPFLVHGFGTKHLTEQFLDQKLGYSQFKKVYLDQKHSDLVHCMDGDSDGVLEGDGLITDSPNLLLMVKTADCLPVLIVDTEKKVIGAVHCGWKGSGQRILQKALMKMKNKYQCRNSSLLAAMGPCICRKCYEVGEDVVGFFRDRKVTLHAFENHPDKEKKYFLDLKKLNHLQLQENGLGKNRIHSVDQCTYENKHLLSYRREGKNPGRMLNFIGLLS